MKYSRHTKGLSLLITAVLLFIGLGSHSVAEERTGTIAGRVVDTEGNPVAEVPVTIVPTRIIGGDIDFHLSPMDYLATRRTRTDAEGRFSIRDVAPGIAYFSGLPENVDKLFPKGLAAKIATAIAEKDMAAIHASGITELESEDFEPDFEVLSLHIRGITFYPRNDFTQIAFGVEPGSDIKNVQVTVQPRMRIRGRVLFKDGTPLRNARLQLRYNYVREDGNGNGSSGGSPRTDADGYFLFYFDEKNDTANYTFSIAYQGLRTALRPILLKPGDRLDGLTLTFDSEPIAAEPPPDRPAFKPPTTLPKPSPIPVAAFDAVWIVNPVNGHAYKRIPCESRDDAATQAAEENAHLVTINDAEEQTWLSAVFGHEFYWIGLSDAEKEGQWQWDNGEPLTYQNWLPDDFFPELSNAKESADESDYVVTTFADGKWSAVSPHSVLLRMTAMAILEKTDVFDGQ